MTQDNRSRAEAYTLTGPAFVHVKSALMLAQRMLEHEYPVQEAEVAAALNSLETAVCSPVEIDLSQPMQDIVAGYLGVDWRCVRERLPADEYADGDVETPKVEMSTCNKCGARYPSAPWGYIHKCTCSGGMMIRDNQDTSWVDVIRAVKEEALERAGKMLRDV